MRGSRFGRMVVMGLLAIGLSACGGDGGGAGGGGSAQVATVEVTPTTVVLTVGQTRQLIAVAKDAAGAILSGQTFTWASSATAVATVDATGLVTAAGTGTASITASAGGITSAPVTVTVASAGNTVGPTGGTLSFLGGAVTMVFPPGAVAAETTITVAASTTATPSFPGIIRGTHYDFGPDGLTFAQPVKVTVRYEPTDVPANVRTEWLQLAKLVGPNWYPEPSTVDTSAHTVSADVRGFSSWAVTTFPGHLKRVRFPDNGAKTGLTDFFIYDMAVDTQGNVIVAGKTTTTVDGSTPVLGGGDALVAKYGPAFAHLWVKQLQTSGGDSASAVGVTSTGIIGVAGTTSGAFAGSAPSLGSATFLTTLTADGQMRAGWPVQEDLIPRGGDVVRQLAGTPLDQFVLLGAVDGSRALRTYLATYDTSGRLLGRSVVDVGAPADIVNDPVEMAGNSLGVYVLMQTLPVNSLTTSNPDWTGWGLAGINTSGAPLTGYPKHQGDTLTGRPLALASDVLGNAYVASFTQVSNGTVRISSFTPDGMPRNGWPVEFEVGDGTIHSMAVDATGNLYIAGTTTQVLGASSAGGLDVFVTSYTGSGQRRANFPVQFGSPGDDDVVKLAIDTSNAVVLAGVFDWFPSTPTPESNDYFIARLSVR